MPIDAIALLRVPPASIPADRLIRALDDGALVRTGARFDEDPEDLAALLCDALGDALDDHEDPRGVLLIPDVAKPSGTAPISRWNCRIATRVLRPRTPSASPAS